MLQHSVCSFDIFVEEVFTTLLSGATPCIPSEATKADIRRLMDYIERNEKLDPRRVVCLSFLGPGHIVLCIVQRFDERGRPEEA